MTQNKIQKQILHDQLLVQGVAERFELNVLSKIDSTSRWVADRVGSSNADFVVCVADEQTAGVGRSGRQWVSPASSHIYMSYSLELVSGVANIAAISLVIGVVVIRVLSMMGVEHLSIKWPNDILLDGKKLVGILIQVKKSAGKQYLVIGIGLNVNMPAKTEFDTQLGWADLASIGVGIEDREHIIALILSESVKAFEQFQKSGFESFKKDWLLLDAWLNQKVVILDGGEIKLSGIERGVDSEGRLLVETAAGMEKIQSGDVSLRKYNG